MDSDNPLVELGITKDRLKQAEEQHIQQEERLKQAYERIKQLEAKLQQTTKKSSR